MSTCFIDSYFTDPDVREVRESRHIGVQFMDDFELTQSVIGDLVTILKELGGLHWTEYFRFVHTRKQENRVLECIVALIDGGTLIERGQFLALRSETAALQSAMDLAGIYCLDIPGIVYPDDLVSLSDQGRDMVEQLGVEGAAEMLLAEHHRPTPKSIN